MKRFTASKKAIVALAASAAILGSTGVAVAYWTTSGSGSSATGATVASNNAATSVTVNEGTAPTGLVPGAVAVSVPVTVTNSAPGSVNVGAVTAAVTSGFTSGTTGPACTASDFTVAGATAAVGTLAAGATSGPLTGITIKMNDGAGNQDNCKGVSVPLTFTAAAGS